MKNFITISNFKINSFYRFPKELMKGKYLKMRLESKMAYAILLDRASLSFANGWCNDNGELFIKIKRKTLMELLSIKGTQKMSMVMEELTNYGLIKEKQCGFGRCNEIYLYEVETQSDEEFSNNGFYQLTFEDTLKNSHRDSDTKEDKSSYENNHKVLNHNNLVNYIENKEDDEFSFKNEKLKAKEVAFENQRVKSGKSKVESFDFQKENENIKNKTNINKTINKKRKNSPKTFENHKFDNRENIELAKEVLGWSVNDKEAIVLLNKAKGNIYILDLAHDAILKSNRKIKNFMGYIKTVIGKFIDDDLSNYRSENKIEGEIYAQVVL